MAGMLAGVESARRRRIHQNVVCSSSSGPGPAPGPSLRPGASLYSRRCSSSIFFANSPSPSMARSRADQVDEKMGQLAREAKERLDERLRAQGKSHSHVTRNSYKGEGRKAREEEERRQKKKKKGWGANAMCKLRSATNGNGMDKQRGQSESESESESKSECAICLEKLRSHEKVVNLDCSHTFHSLCLLPWLDSHSLCPCCRTSILSFSSS